MCEKCVSKETAITIEGIELKNLNEVAFLRECDDEGISLSDLETYYQKHEEEKHVENELLQAEGAFDKMSPGIQTIEERARGLMVALKFPDKGGYLELDKCLSEVQRAWTFAEEKRTELTGPLNAVIRKINEIARKKIEPLAFLKEEIRTKMGVYLREEKAWELKEKEKLEAEERRRREDERLRLAAEAEKSGNNRLATALVEKPVYVPEAKVETARGEARSGSKTVWKANVIDLKAFLRGIADGQIDPSYVEVKTAALDRAANSLKSAMTWPGVRVYEDVQVISRR